MILHLAAMIVTGRTEVEVVDTWIGAGEIMKLKTEIHIETVITEIQKGLYEAIGIEMILIFAKMGMKGVVKMMMLTDGRRTSATTGGETKILNRTEATATDKMHRHPRVAGKGIWVITPAILADRESLARSACFVRRPRCRKTLLSLCLRTQGLGSQSACRALTDQCVCRCRRAISPAIDVPSALAPLCSTRWLCPMALDPVTW
jgi:hypothetical protein